MKSVALFIAIVAAILALPFLLPSDGVKHGGVVDTGLPWQIERLPDGATRVFGLTLGRSTLDDARSLLGDDVQVALVVAPGETGAVEAYYETLTVGSIAGKMVLSLVSTREQREQMLVRAKKVKYMDSTTRRVELSADDLVQMAAAAITAIAYIPAASLDEQIVLQRFGVPAERIRSGEHREHFLYPERGLDLQLDAKGKELLQYVAPKDFARLREPLMAAQKVGAGGTAAQ
jgi:hypothetical protein